MNPASFGTDFGSYPRPRQRKKNYIVKLEAVLSILALKVPTFLAIFAQFCTVAYEAHRTKTTFLFLITNAGKAAPVRKQKNVRRKATVTRRRVGLHNDRLNPTRMKIRQCRDSRRKLPRCGVEHRQHRRMCDPGYKTRSERSHLVFHLSKKYCNSHAFTPISITVSLSSQSQLMSDQSTSLFPHGFGIR